MLEIKCNDVSFTLKKAEMFETKQGIKCLKCKGTLNNKVYLNEESEKPLTTKNYFGKVFIYGEEDYLNYVCETLWKPENEKGIKIIVDECYCELPFFMGNVWSSLHIVKSDLSKKKFYKKTREAENLLIKYKLKIPKDLK